MQGIIPPPNLSIKQLYEIKVRNVPYNSVGDVGGEKVTENRAYRRTIVCFALISSVLLSYNCFGTIWVELRSPDVLSSCIRQC